MQTASKKVINGWAMYDWANSVYNLVITTTFFPIYFTAVTPEKVPFFGNHVSNSALYTYSVAVAYFIIAILYPFLTSIADTRGNKKQFMQFFCYMGALGCSLLYFFDKTNVWWGVSFFMVAAIGYCGSLVFYNSYLPEIAAEQDRDRISAKGYSYGYVGSVLLQVIGFALVMTMADEGQATRLTFLLTGIWWLGFAQISFRVLPRSQPSIQKHTAGVFKESISEIKKVYAQVKQMPVLKRFLRGFFFYSMGVQTVMLAATLFGAKVLELSQIKLIITIVIIQLVAIIGAWAMSKLSAIYGNLKVLFAVVVIWILICVAAYYTAVLKEHGTDPEFHFYGLAVAVGLVMGGIQSLSRSTYSKLMPETADTASFFSYYDFTEKIAIVLGMFSWAAIDDYTGNMKTSLLSLIVFFAIGLIWLYSALHKQQQKAS
ncbi:MFS transporter [Paraflavitalea sp. CAU 1676]|uniref:MFS transporter n=1 Tax=Paraflavitalea sp. CAU 1676 TaxID=3032598 RepID=UPI0023DC58A9|nr:MFS transporter [Paraflavitalea sp. CAU 1676]MDF2187364.1 MFS transporter [Paraflavitalea sp. CAU 1676]